AATATIARAVVEGGAGASAPPAGGPARPGPLPALWQQWEPRPARHPVKAEPARAVADRADDPRAGQTCATCAWHYRGGPGKPVSRCRQADRARVEPTWPACDRWEGELDCQECGACCRAAYHSVTVPVRDPARAAHPELLVDRGDYVELVRIDDPRGNRCVALSGGIYTPGYDTPGHDEPALATESGVVAADDHRAAREQPWQPYTCAIYADRPRPCREFERAGVHCLTARRRVGLSR
ncbi:MAG: hypothetical protein AAGC55_02145, partial [Myxococcota bacterium]